MGPENTVAFFEWSGTETFAKPAGVPTDRFPMQNVGLQRWTGSHWVGFGGILSAGS